MHVFVLILRGLPLGYVGCYGNGWIDTPALDRLAAESIAFDQHIADSPDATGARRAWRTGRHQFPCDSVPADPAIDLIRLLRDWGVVTSIVFDDSVDTTLTWVHGWDRVRRVSADDGAAPFDRLLEAVGDALDEAGETERGLLWVELATLLPPWNVPPKYLDQYLHPPASEEGHEADDPGEEKSEPLLAPKTGFLEEPEDGTFLRLQASLAAAVSYVDAAVGNLLDMVDERGLGEDVMLIVTTDHGQALGEHGIVGPHRPWLHEELIHVPLLMRLPSGVEAGRRVAALTQPVDLYPTLLEAFGCTPDPSHGRSLLPLLQGGIGEPRSYVASALRLGDREEWALRTLEWAFLLPVGAPDDPARLPQLYVKPEDRWEVNNVIQHHLETAEMLEKTLRAFTLAVRQPGPLEVPALEGPSP
jgi:arylsulfatase A-like enzyme